MKELVEMEVRELLSNYGYDGDNSPVINSIFLFLIVLILNVMLSLKKTIMLKIRETLSKLLNLNRNQSQ